MPKKKKRIEGRGGTRKGARMIWRKIFYMSIYFCFQPGFFLFFFLQYFLVWQRSKWHMIIGINSVLVDTFVHFLI